jgi:hypothetical protein
VPVRLASHRLRRPVTTAARSRRAIAWWPWGYWISATRGGRPVAEGPRIVARDDRADRLMTEAEPAR